MRIATWNVNSLTARLQHVLDWLIANPVDVLCLQELKMTDDKFPLDVLKSAGYEAAVFGQKTYNGVAILSLAPVRDVVKNITGFSDDQSRVIAATVETPSGPLRVVNGYFVNGQAPGTDKFEYKMKWLDALRDSLRQELVANPDLVLLGDFNITPEERQHFRQLLELGLTDAFRMFEQPEKSYSWWDYRMLGYQKNRGLRIDHILVSESLVPSVKGCVIDRVPRKWEKPSDHAPVVLDLDRGG